MFGKQEPLYSRLKDEDTVENDPARLCATRRATALWYLVLTCLLMSVAANIWTFQFWLSSDGLSGRPAWRKSLDALTQGAVKFNSTFSPDSKFVGLNRIVDAEWDRYTASPWIDGTSVVLDVSTQDIEGSGKKDDGLHPAFNTTVQLGEDNGGGYMATLELFHQLHCLNVLRKTAHKEYYAEKDSFFSSGELMEHTDHCVEMLRQVLMCQSDPQLITFHWVRGWKSPVPDFNTWHTCRDPESLLRWAKDREAPMKHHPRKPEGAAELLDRP